MNIDQLRLVQYDNCIYSMCDNTAESEQHKRKNITNMRHCAEDGATILSREENLLDGTLPYTCT